MTIVLGARSGLQDSLTKICINVIITVLHQKKSAEAPYS